MSPLNQLLLRRTTRYISRNILRKKSSALNKLIVERSYFSTHNSKHLNDTSSSSRHSSSFHSRDVSLTLLSGGILLLSYSYLTTKGNPLSLDSINTIKEFSTFFNNQNSGKNGNTQNKEGTIMILAEDQIEKKLHDNEESHSINRNKGIFRYDVSQLPSNHPIEDNHVEQIITIPNEDQSSNDEEDLYFFGIFDGHSGTFTSKKLSQDLVRYVANQIHNSYDSITTATMNGLFPSSTKIDNAIKSGFLKLDNDIVQESFRKLFQSPTNENMINTLPAISGSCALLTMYNSLNKTLKVAVTGDSRALLCGKDENGNWTVESLSIDQTGDNVREVERIRNLHPNEPNVIRNGRILGSLQPSRAFGDYRYKVKEVDGKQLSELPDHVKIYFRKEPRDFLTPPYVTAEPEITTTKITDKTKFMVLGSDGLFELLTNEQVAGLVVRWMESNNLIETVNATPLGKLPNVKDLTTDMDSQRPPFRYNTKDKNRDYAKNPEYLMQDKNVATHLIRNALSAGGKQEYVSTLVSIPSPMSRRYRDDLTVTVAFFGDSGENSDGSMVINPEATTPPKPRL
ncbi:type 2C protein phosphatase PTC5 NDAI_0B04060 [Naumovozyma dairenensis CBS 421]|uniref:PPM-type phosphatase domain-containing protein n=1 Tax=Naumovozyma dairenensis (strain ATCC 10597 / BCRC 20456 / CBS 421 / NBRC 0211 / NRRL Y-12639) TaxID=1071378 RepID=G0W6M9_NAUDC|nr:hypothetical protein NDAI_0B04060 [Naumovozyma dairenensis CBS 421]CCD23440.1 hypothetical protein NDAI_0B04060 [Naumovozyma dairenensis CBS 421]